MKKITFKYVPILALVLLFLATGQVNAGDVTTLYAKALTTWSSSDLGTSAWATTVTSTTSSYAAAPEINTTLGLNLPKKVRSQEISNTTQINPDANTILTIDAVWNVGNTDVSGTKTNKTYLKIGDNIEFLFSNYNGKTKQGKVILLNDTFAISNVASADDEWTIHLVINTATKKVTNLTVKGTEGTNVASFTLGETVSLSTNATFNSLSMGCTRAVGSVGTSLKSISITQETQDIKTASYTVNYTNSNNTVKTVTGTAAVDSYIPVLTAMDGDGEDYSATRYVIVADAVPSQAIVSGTNTLTVPVRPVYQATLNVYRILDGTQEANPFITQALTETDAKVASYTYVFPYYYNDGNKYYKATLKGESTDQFGETGTFTNESITKTVEYTTDDDVVYFADFDTDNNNNISYSNGAIEASTKSEKISTALDAGYYYITVNQAATFSSSLMNGNTSLATINDDGRTKLFKLTEAVSSDALTVSDETNMRLDYILIKKAPTVSATVTTAGLATFSSDKALDFTNVTDISAYIATSIDDNNNLVMTKVTGAVPASTGLLLKGTVGTAVTTTIPVAVSATAPTTNYFKSSVTDTKVAATDVTSNVYHYFLMSGDNGTGFYNVDKEMTSAAGKAYLETSSALATASSASPINLIFNDGSTITGINTINTVQKASNKIYDLCGQEVAAPNKGLYIMNGKKVIIK